MDWNILGIEATTDKGSIRKAYAAQVKKYHPEEHPDEYKRLKDAYNQALKYADQNKAAQEEQEKNDGTDQLEEQGIFYKEAPENSEKKLTGEWNQAVEIPKWPLTGKVIPTLEEHMWDDQYIDILNQIKHLYEMPLLFNELGAWKQLFLQNHEEEVVKEERFWYVLLKDLLHLYSLSDEVRVFLREQCKKNIPNAALCQYLDEMLGIEEKDEIKFQVAYDDDDRLAIFQKIYYDRFGERLRRAKIRKEVEERRQYQNTTSAEQTTEYGGNRYIKYHFIPMAIMIFFILIARSCSSDMKKQETPAFSNPSFDYIFEQNKKNLEELQSGDPYQLMEQMQKQQEEREAAKQKASETSEETTEETSEQINEKISE